ncbi:glycosyltransferase family 87 protein [Afifella sp. YEN Y35]|uniref:glycosyltransferase family 87 protein n=1 Tax=Afifella sp. YEN Y35 TaxID=3388337 RepID=UPI0039DFE5BD
MPQFTILNDRRFWLFFAFALTLAGFPLHILLNWIASGDAYALPLHPGGADFLNFWVASQTALHGDAAHLYDPASYSAILIDRYGSDFDYRWLYPPHFLFFLLPLGLMPYWTAFTVFMVTTLALFALVGSQFFSSRHSILWLAFAPSSVLTIIMGQASLLIGTIFITAVFLWDRRPILCGILIGLLTIKPHFGVLLPIVLLIERRWLIIMVASATTTALVILSALLFGADAWTGFLGNLGSAQGDVLRTSGSLLTAQVTPFGAVRYAGASLETAWLVQLVCTLLAVLAAATAALSSARRDTKAAIIIFATCLAVPYVLVYDLVAPTFAALFLFLGEDRNEAPGLGLSFLLVVLIDFSFLNGWIAAGENGVEIGPVILAALVIALLVRARREDTKQHRGDGDKRVPEQIAHPFSLADEAKV